MQSKIQRLLLGAAFAMAIVGGVASHPTPTLAAKVTMHCHNLNRIDYWVVTGIDSASGGVWCVGSIE